MTAVSDMLEFFNSSNAILVQPLLPYDNAYASCLRLFEEFGVNEKRHLFQSFDYSGTRAVYQVAIDFIYPVIQQRLGIFQPGLSLYILPGQVFSSPHANRGYYYLG